MIKIKKILLTLSMVAVGLTALSFAAPKAQALSGSSFNPGRIIDDSVFFDKNSMSVGEIQNFLYAKSGPCDTNRPTTDSRYQPPWTCLYQYRENTTTHVNNIGSPTTNPSGSITAAQIIYNAAQTYNISPKALIVLIQKESSLITDNWPWSNQYRSATGYGCPDTAPCNSEYYGFYNQVNKAAFQFRRYATYPNEYNYKAGRNNNIGYNPNAACGSQTVFIQNQATAGLYNYTPYVPNAAALNNLYGTGDGCSAYGNRNFWRLFNDWFGGTTAPAYSWQIVDQQVKAYVTGENLDISGGLPSGEKVIFYVRAQNTGTATWVNNGSHPVRIATSSPTGRQSIFCEPSWLACTTPVSLLEGSIAPGQVGTFQFTSQMPLATGNYTENFNLLSEGVTWMNDVGLRFSIKVIPATLSYSVVSNTVPTTVVAGQTASGTITIKNTGNVSWFNQFKYPVRMGTANPLERTSIFQTNTWVAKNRPAVQNEFRVLPQQNATFNFSGKAPETNGVYPEGFALLMEALQWGSTQIPMSFTVTGGAAPSAQPTDTLSINQSLGLNQSLRSPNGTYRLTLQGDGNMVVHNNTTRRTVWMTGTQGKGTARLVMQPDGNLVLYSSQGKYLWGSKTNGKGANRLVMQNDGNVVLLTAQNQIVWATGTAGKR